ncbi:MAG: hypothetical protein IJ700_04820 [Bacteroidaceae bacterium]|nr:hypothetical protein [Bacteroidaceae bacterium]
MKKTYMQPQVAVVKTTPATIIATSTPLDSSDANKLNDPNDILTKDQQDWNIWE